MKNRIFTALFFVAAGILIAAGPLHIFGVCEPTAQKTMKCVWTARAEIGVGTLIALLGATLAAMPPVAGRLGLSIALTLAGCLAVLLPETLIGVCGNPMMQCRLLTYPALLLLGSLVAAVGLVNSLYLFRLLKR